MKLVIETALIAIAAVSATLLNNALRGEPRQKATVYLKSRDSLREWSIMTALCLITLWTPRVLELLQTKATARYSFEDGQNLAWRVPTREDCAQRGCALFDVAQGEEHSKDGTRSLSVDVHLLGRKPNQAATNDQGEVFVDLLSNPPRGYQAGEPVSLRGRTVSAHVYVPDTHDPEDRLISTYRESKPGYLQLFFETCNRVPIRINGDPVQLRSGGQYPLAFRFDFRDHRAAAICRIGIKMGLNPGDAGEYEGRIFIDDVDWRPRSWSEVIGWTGMVGLVGACLTLGSRWRGRRQGNTPQH